MYFIPHKVVHTILLCKSVGQTILMFIHSLDQIRCYSSV